MPNSQILTLAFSLPIEDPNHVPVTHYLLNAKRAMILQWMDGCDGRPAGGRRCKSVTVKA
jgi:hypothetical protein